MGETRVDECEGRLTAVAKKSWRDPANDVRIVQLTGPEFEDALSGTFDEGHKRLTKAWLRVPKLKYYMPRSPLLRLFQEQDTRLFFLASAPSAEPDDERRVPVAALELAFFHGETTRMGLKYVSVDPAYRGFGLARELYTRASRHLKAHQLTLNRSRAGAHTPEAFTAAISRLLDAEGVAWSQGH